VRARVFTTEYYIPFGVPPPPTKDGPLVVRRYFLF